MITDTTRKGMKTGEAQMTTAPKYKPGGTAHELNGQVKEKARQFTNGPDRILKAMLAQGNTDACVKGSTGDENNSPYDHEHNQTGYM